MYYPNGHRAKEFRYSNGRMHAHNARGLENIWDSWSPSVPQGCSEKHRARMSVKRMIDFLVFIKPDGYRRALTNQCLSYFEREGFIVKKSKVITATKEQVNQHYAEHAGKEWLPAVVDFTVSGPIELFVLHGDLIRARQIQGATDPKQAEKGTIRGDFGTGIPDNVIHCSGDEEAAKREINLWFGGDSDSSN